MPNKTVYVTAADLPLFDRAARKAGGLSPAIAAALRTYLDDHNQSEGNMRADTAAPDDVVELEVQEGAALVRTRFRGRRVAKLRQSYDVREVIFELYRTAKGQHALYVVDRPNWSRWSGDASMWEDSRTWHDSFFASRDRSLTVFATAAELVGSLPDDLRAAAADALVGPALRELDI